MKYIDKYNKVLGDEYGRCNHRLKQKYIFHLIKSADENVCYRCGQPIESSDDLSYEHKISWIPSKENGFIGDKNLYYDLNNLCFSHIFCNCGASGLGKGKFKYAGLGEYYEKKDINKLFPRYKVSYGLNGKHKAITCCHTQEEAGIAYDIAVFWYRNGCGVLNFPEFREEYKLYLQKYAHFDRIFYKRGPIKQIVQHFYTKLLAQQNPTPQPT